MNRMAKTGSNADVWASNAAGSLPRQGKLAAEPGETRRIPVFVVVPPRLLLLDIAGPLEVLRQANRVQESVRFEVEYVGPRATLQTSIGVTPVSDRTATRRFAAGIVDCAGRRC